MGSGEVEVRRATADEGATVAAVLAAAMSADPVMEWILNGRRDIEGRLRVMFGALVNRALQQAEHEVYLAHDGSGAALWRGIDRWRMSPADMARLSPTAMRVGFLGIRAIKLNSALQRAHPRMPHRYLEILGTRPHQQGRGTGSGLLAAVLGRCDAEGVPVYLENSNPGNAGFYARHGFEATPPFPLPPGCPPFTPMWRQPRPTS